MKMYSSLIYRQLRLTRKHTILSVILFLLFEALVIMPIVLWNKSPTTDEEQLQFPTYCIFISLLVAALGSFMAGLNNGIHKSDINTGWKRYSYVLPPSAKQKALSDLLVKLLTVLVFFALAAVYALPVYIFGGEAVFVHILGSYFLIAAVAVLFDTLHTCILMLAKDKKDLKKFGYIASAAGLVLFGLLPDTGFISFEAAEKIASAIGSYKFTLTALLTFAVMCAVYFFVMKKTYERREP